MAKHKMVSMELSQEEKKKAAKGPEAVEAEHKYPYGLTLQLEDDVLDKLGLKDLPKIGTTMTVSAMATVESVSIRENSSDRNSRDISLQITDLGLYPAEEEKKSEEVLYGKEKEKE